MESSAVPNITDELTSVRSRNVSVDIEYVNITTECRIDNDERNCTCKENFTWSNDVCSSHPDCCTVEYCIVQTLILTSMCIPNSRVTVTGSITLTEEFVPDLANSSSKIFKDKSVKLTNILKTNLSKLNGFDSVIITSFRSGSLIADFKLTVNSHFTSRTLAEKINALKTRLNANISVETKGLVIMEMPNMPVCFDSETKISCEFPELVNATWTLRQEKTIIDIVNGTEATIVAEGYKSYLTLKKASAVWKGFYECIFLVDSIVNKASGQLDVALLPETVNIIREPQFPDCYNNKDKILDSKLRYEITNDDEKYKVHHAGNKITAKYQGPASPKFIIYEVETKINCETNIDNDHDVEISFRNRLNQTLNISTTIPVIKRLPYCKVDNEWPKAKNACKATLPCSDGNAGYRERKCDSDGVWEDEISYCVQQALSSLLQEALSIGKGRGSFQKNAMGLFTRMKDTTSYIDDMNTYANINASVNILSVVSDASNSSNISKPLNIQTFQDVLHSASNLLNESLNTSWKIKHDINSSLSTTYLKAVEGLSKQTAISGNNVLN
ncbi:hypothetical protein COCON_G00012540, partial [Conger conger]